jgi:hypothetical protein
MPHLNTLLHAYNLIAPFNIGSSRVLSIIGEEQTISRYHHYHYDIKVYMNFGKDYIKDLNLLQDMLQGRTVYTEYGNPYATTLKFKRDKEQNVLYQNWQKQQIIFIEGDAIRIYEKKY